MYHDYNILEFYDIMLKWKLVASPKKENLLTQVLGNITAKQI